MSISPHLVEDETILARCTTDQCEWVCTEKRVLRYKSESGSTEQLHDLSLSEISAISFVDTGKSDKLKKYGILSITIGVLSFILFGFTRFIPFLPIGSISPIIGCYLLYKWLNSQEAYFEFRGSGILQSESENWRIDQTDTVDPSDAQDFVKTVRSQL